MTTRFEVAQDVDATGLLCPLPVLKAAKCIRALKSGQILLLRTDDPAAVVDVPHFCAESRHELLHQENEGGAHLWWIRRA